MLRNYNPLIVLTAIILSILAMIGLVDSLIAYGIAIILIALGLVR